MWVDSSIFLASKGERQQNPASEAWLLPLTLESFIGSSAEAAKKHVGRRFSCLWRSSHLESPSQRQQTSPSEAILVAFGKNASKTVVEVRLTGVATVKLVR